MDLFDKLETVVGAIEQLTQKISQRDQLKAHRDNIVKKKPFPRFLNQVEVIEYVGKEKIFRILVEEYGLKPIEQTHMQPRQVQRRHLSVLLAEGVARAAVVTRLKR